MTKSGDVTYARNPDTPHGSHNYADHEVRIDPEFSSRSRRGEEYGANSQGYLMYDRGVRADHAIPSIVSAKDSTKRREKPGLRIHDLPESLHVTQVYQLDNGDEYRVSWDSSSDGTVSGKHWTKQKSKGRAVARGRSGRHDKPNGV